MRKKLKNIFYWTGYVIGTLFMVTCLVFMFLAICVCTDYHWVPIQ